MAWTSAKRASRRKGVLRHGHTAGGNRHPLYLTWASMKGRCRPENTDPSTRTYRAKGITVCERWRIGDGRKSGFVCFLEDMGERPTPEHTIDRIDNDGNYEPGNCRWATRAEQHANQEHRGQPPKVSVEQVLEIRAARARGEPVMALADQYKITVSAIYKIAQNIRRRAI